MPWTGGSHLRTEQAGRLARQRLLGSDAIVSRQAQFRTPRGGRSRRRPRARCRARDCASPPTSVRAMARPGVRRRSDAFAAHLADDPDASGAASRCGRLPPERRSRRQAVHAPRRRGEHVVAHARVKRVVPCVHERRVVGPQRLDREVRPEQAAPRTEERDRGRGDEADQRLVDAADERALAGELDDDVGRACEQLEPCAPRGRRAPGRRSRACRRGPARRSCPASARRARPRRPSGRGRPAARRAGRARRGSATLRRKTGSRIRSGALAKRSRSSACQCSWTRSPRTSGERSSWRSKTAAARSSNMSAEAMTACGQPCSSCWDCSHSTSSTTRSAGQFACT